MIYRKDVDGLRAVAVLLVIAFHAFPNFLPNGYLGVDIFFVISGFLITSIILHNLSKNSFSFVNFYIRRIKRIFPMALIVLSFVSVLGMLTLFDTEFKNLKSYIRPAAGFYINFQLLNDAGYFDVKSTYKPLLHYWSLAIEEQFYILWPFLLFAMYKAVSFFTKGRAKESLNHLIALNTLLLLVAYTYFLSQPSDQYFSSLVRAWELLLGCLVAIAAARINVSGISDKSFSQFSLYLSSVGLILICLAQGLTSTHLSTSFCVLGTAFFLIAKESLQIKSFFRAKPLVYIGLLSYSLYLWHWPFLSFYRTFKPNLNTIETLILVLTAFVMSYFTYQFVEAPLKKQNWDLEPRGLLFSWNRKMAVSLASCTLCIIPAGILLKYGPRFPKLSDEVVNQLVFVEDDALGLSSNCILNEKQRKEFDLTWCYSQARPKKYQGLIFGDSHSHSLFKGIVSNESEVAWQLVGKHSCPPFNLDNRNPDCRNIVKHIADTLKLNVDIHYVAFVMAHRIFEENEKNLQDPNYLENIVSDLRIIQSTGKKIILVKPVPEIAENIYACTNLRFSFYQAFDSTDACRITFESWKQRTNNFITFIDYLKRNLPETIVVDPTVDICDGDFCYAARQGKALYEDKDHLSFYGSQKVANRITEALQLKGLKKGYRL